MFPHLTVLETLTLAAQFYLPTTFSFQQKDDIVNSTIAELGLVKAKSTIIGRYIIDLMQYYFICVPTFTCTITSSISLLLSSSTLPSSASLQS